MAPDRQTLVLHVVLLLKAKKHQKNRRQIVIRTYNMLDIGTPHVSSEK